MDAAATVAYEPTAHAVHASEVAAAARLLYAPAVHDVHPGLDDGALLVIPGPVALPPGRPNPSRGRARAVLFAQTCHGRPTPAVPDFNSVGVRRTAPALAPLLAYDRVAGGRGGPLAPGVVAGLQALGVRAVVLMRDDPGLTDEEDLRQGLLAQGARLVGALGPAPGSPELWALPGPPSRPAQEDVQQPIR